MAFTVDKCDSFDGLKCTKCGRMMPDLCKDQQSLEEKAKKYDAWIASQEAPGHTDLMVSPEAIDEVLEDEEAKPAPSTTPTVKRRGPNRK